MTHAKGLSEVLAGSLAENLYGVCSFPRVRHNFVGVGLTALRVGRLSLSMGQDIGWIQTSLMEPRAKRRKVFARHL